MIGEKREYSLNPMARSLKRLFLRTGPDEKATWVSLSVEQPTGGGGGAQDIYKL